MGSFHMRLKDLFCIEEPSLLWMDLLEIKSLSLLIHQIHIIFLKIKMRICLNNINNKQKRV